MTGEEVYNAVQQFPQGASVKQISDFLGKQANSASSVLSKLVAYGKIDRRLVDGKRDKYTYHPKSKQQLVQAAIAKVDKAVEEIAR